MVVAQSWYLLTVMPVYVSSTGVQYRARAIWIREQPFTTVFSPADTKFVSLE
jgi:hypothetical protein